MDITAILQYANDGAECRISTCTQYAEQLSSVGAIVSNALQAGNMILLCGNGGSAAEAQHIAAEYVGRFSKRERLSLPALALTTDTSILTAIGNDYGFEAIFEKQVEAFGKKGDILIASSTSGNSPNCISAIHVARKKGMYIIGFTGQSGGAMLSLCDAIFCVPSPNTAIVQEVHLALQHILCAVAENLLPPHYDTQ